MTEKAAMTKACRILDKAVGKIEKLTRHRRLTAKGEDDTMLEPVLDLLKPVRKLARKLEPMIGPDE